MAAEEGGVPFLLIYVLFTLLLTAWELYLDFRQFRKNKETEPPAEIKDLVPLDRFQKSQVYQAERRAFSIVSSVITTAANLAEVALLWPLLWRSTEGLAGGNEYVRSVVWQIMTTFISLPVSIPLQLYGDFVIEARHGFNKKTLKLFVMDTLKNAAISVVVTAILVPIVIAVIRWGGDQFYWYIWAVCQILIFVVMFVYPTVIMPLFNKFEPLHDEGLRKQIEDLASSLGYPLQKLFQMDGSKRSAHSNAFLFGFWKNKRIVLYDTLLQVQVNLSKEAGTELGFQYSSDGRPGLLVKDMKLENTAVGKWNELHAGRIDELKEGALIVGFRQGSDVIRDVAQLTTEMDKLRDEPQGSLNVIIEGQPYSADEILAILCHEIGHWFHSHVTRMLVVSSAHIFLIFRLYAFAMKSQSLLTSFGFASDERSVMVSLSIFMLMFTPVETVFGFFMVTLTRIHEYQADEFAVKQKRAEPLCTGLRKLCIENLGDVNPDPWFAWFHHTHPALVERLKAIKAKESALGKKSD